MFFEEMVFNQKGVLIFFIVLFIAILFLIYSDIVLSNKNTKLQEEVMSLKEENDDLKIEINDKDLLIERYSTIFHKIEEDIAELSLTIATIKKYNRDVLKDKKENISPGEK